MKCPLCHHRTRKHCNTRLCKWYVCDVCQLMVDVAGMRAVQWDRMTGISQHYILNKPTAAA